MISLGKPWENHGKTMGKPWENHGKTMGKPWETHGKMVIYECISGYIWLVLWNMNGL